MGKSIELLRPKGKRLSDRKNREIFLKTGQSSYIGKTVEGEAYKKDGAVFLTETSTACWEVGGRTIFCGIVRDITERRQHEREIEEREEQFRAIAESSPDAIITADSSGKIIYWNKAAETMYGYKANEIVGKSIELLRPEGKQLSDRKNRENFLKTGQSFTTKPAGSGTGLGLSIARMILDRHGGAI